MLAVSRRTTRRYYLFVPDLDREVEQVFWYCLGIARLKSGVRIHAAMLMSNHIHIDIQPRLGHANVGRIFSPWCDANPAPATEPKSIVALATGIARWSMPAWETPWLTIRRSPTKPTSSSDDVDMVLLESDLEPRTVGDQTQTRALHEFGRYLGCWSGASDNEADLMSEGNELHAWHGWPWWRRIADHLDLTARTEGSRHGHASVVIIRLLATDERTRRTELEQEAGQGTDAEQQALLRSDDAQIDPDQVGGAIGTALLVGLGVGLGLLMVIGVGVIIDEAI